jgi:VWFA-related protein
VHQDTRCFGPFVVSLLVLWACVHPQPSQAGNKSNQPEDPPASQAQSQAAAPEISSNETQPGFAIRARANEVLVRVVVRDAQGKAVATLTKDDFRLLDNGKPQAIREFSVELARAALASTAEKSNLPAVENPQVESAAPVPERFVALYFDDTFMSFDDVVRTRNAATRYLKNSITPGDRVGLYTSSGQGNVEFTSDLSALEEALAKLRPRPTGSSQQATDCLNFSEYESYLMSEKEDVQALQLGVSKVVNCVCGHLSTPPGTPANVTLNPCTFDPTQYAKATARGIWQSAQLAVLQSLRGLEALVRRLSTLPGQRSIVWISPGFLGLDQTFEMSSLIDHALRARVVINALDSRGLWSMIPGGNASQQGPGLSAKFSALDAQYAHTAQQIDTDVMIAATSGTGGVFFHDSNDYDGGFRLVGALPESAYLLSFSPQNLKYDGKYHNLKVELVNGRGLSLQARKGYFAPAEAPDSERQAKEELQDAVFSRDERKDIPLEIQMQFFMTSKSEGQLSVLARVDLRGVRLHKEQQRNVDELRFVAALFDENGNLLEGQARDVDLRLQDATLNKLLVGGLRTGWHFKVRPGTYVLREVVRDMGSGGIAALSRTVEIPYPN